MTRRRLLGTVVLVAVFICAYVVAMVTVAIRNDGSASSMSSSKVYMLLKDLVPLVLAVPAAALAYSFNRRSAHLTAFHDFWDAAVKSVQLARHYTLRDAPDQVTYLAAKEALSTTIDVLRSLKPNIAGKLYPHDELKHLHDEFLKLNSCQSTAWATMSVDVRKQLDDRWKQFRGRFLPDVLAAS